MNNETQWKNRNKRIQQQAEIDPICAAYIKEQNTQQYLGNGFSWIETQLNIEDDNDEDFRPF